MLHRAVSVILLFAFVSACAVNPVTGRKELMLVSEEQEVAIGRDIYPNAIWGAEGGGGEYKDAALKVYLRDIALGIHGISHRPNLPVEFAVQNSSVPNAWAIPGYVVITRGLLAALRSEAEFVFVMGHEMGHVAARHSARQMTYGLLQQVGLGAAGIALGGEEHGDVVLGAGAVGSTLVLLKYGREQELEADRLGVEYMARLGYDPKNAVSAHKRLEEASSEYLKSLGKDSRERGFFQDMLSTHPRTSVRVEEIEQIIRATPPSKILGDGTGGEKFLAMTEELRKADETYRRHYDPAARAYDKGDIKAAEALVLKAIDEMGNQAPFWTLRGFIALKKKDFQSADGYFSKALAIDIGYQPAMRGVGALRHSEGRHQEAIVTLKEAVSIFPEDIYSRYFLGMSLHRTDRCEEAIRHLGHFAEALPRHPEIHGVLGQCYEKINDPHSAYEEYQLQIKVAPDTEMGAYAAGRLRALRGVVGPRRR